MRPVRRLLPFLLVAAVSSLVTAGAVALPAFADEHDEPEAPTLRGLEERMREFDSCMREHGFDVRPENGRAEVLVTPEGVRVNGQKVDADAFRKAQQECGPPRLFPADPEALPAPPFDFDVPPELRERRDRLDECLELERGAEEEV